MLHPTYDAFVTREGKQVLAEFPDRPGCQTFADSPTEVATALGLVLNVALEAAE